jgi:hypothetical protein
MKKFKKLLIFAMLQSSYVCFAERINIQIINQHYGLSGYPKSIIVGSKHKKNGVFTVPTTEQSLTGSKIIKAFKSRTYSINLDDDYRYMVADVADPAFSNPIVTYKGSSFKGKKKLRVLFKSSNITCAGSLE